MSYFNIKMGYRGSDVEAGGLPGVLGVTKNRLIIRSKAEGGSLDLKDDDVLSLKAVASGLFAGPSIQVRFKTQKGIESSIFYPSEESTAHVLQRIAVIGFKPRGAPAIKKSRIVVKSKNQNSLPNKWFVGTPPRGRVCAPHP